MTGHRFSALSCAMAGLALVLAGCGSQATTTGPQVRTSGRAKARSTARPRRSKLSVSVASAGILPAAIQDAAAVSLDQGRLVLLGGVDAGDASTPSIVVLAN